MKFQMRHVGRATLGIAGVAAIAFAVPRLLEERFLSSEGGYEEELADTVGEIRHNKLDELTSEYVAENPEGKLLLIAGDRFAPLPYLNGELSDMHAAWRVRLVDGAIEFREVT